MHLEPLYNTVYCSLKDEINLNLIEVASLLLGIGVFLLWCGLFAYLQYFETLSVSVLCICIASR